MKHQVLFASVVGICLFVADRFLKGMVTPLPSGTVLFSFGPFGIEKLLNRNLFVWIPTQGTVMLALSGIVFACLSVALIYFLFKKIVPIAAPLFLIWFGGLSNLLDRISFSSTIDYIKIGGLIGNIADFLVILGLIWLFSACKKQKQSPRTPEQTA